MLLLFSGIFFCHFVNGIFRIYFEDSDLRDTSLAIRPKQISKNVPVLLQNRLYITSTYCRKSKLLMHLSRNYDFVFTTLLKNEAD